MNANICECVSVNCVMVIHGADRGRRRRGYAQVNVNNVHVVCHTAGTGLCYYYISYTIHIYTYRNSGLYFDKLSEEETH